MAFYLQVSNSLKDLADQLSAEIQHRPKSVFDRVPIVTQTEGMNSWLKIQIADKQGIAANIQFLKPNELINQIFYRLGGKYTGSLTRDDLTWLIFKIAGSNNFSEKFPEVAIYYQQETDNKPIKRMALAQKVADLFDQYQIYRPAMIHSWNENKLATRYPEEVWQQYIWYQARALAGNNFPDKTIIGETINSQIENPEAASRLQEKLPVVYLFGISVVTQYHLQIFEKIAEYIDIHFFILNPAPDDYWYDDKSEKQIAFLKKIGKLPRTEISSGNPLLASWGKIIRDTFVILFQNDFLINNYETISNELPPADSLLHVLQRSVFENFILPKNSIGTELLTDGTLTINSCYSPAREVEVLYNYLVHLIDKKRVSLSARDIVVMVSDIDEYASYIKAIFDKAPFPIPYTIADESFADTDSLSNALHALLSLSENNFTAEEVVRLMDFSSIRKTADIKDTGFVRKITNEANIRFGTTGKYEDDSIYVSWTYGLRRIMFGLCISGGEEYGEGADSFYPVDNVESGDMFKAIRWVSFVENLMSMLQERKKDRLLSDWVNYVESLIEIFLQGKEENPDEDYIQLQEQLEEYQPADELFGEKISYEVFLFQFLPKLTTSIRSKSFAGKGITFCSLIPMRSIPFKIVAMMGMNFDKFPRKEHHSSFNLIEKERRRGDRNVKENDKHLFLETILSAREYLYISYTGQNITDNKPLPPSILVDELINAIEQAAELPNQVRNSLITPHPLHGFNDKYATEGERFYSYLLGENNTPKKFDKIETSDPPVREEVSIHQLIAFLSHPVKGYFNQVLNIFYENEPVTLTDTELFNIDPLQSWGLKKELLNTDPEQLESIRNEKLRNGLLPLKNMSSVVLHQTNEEITAIRKIYHDIKQNTESSTIPLKLKVGGILLTGEVDQIYDDKHIFISFSKREMKHLIKARILNLALIAAGHEKELHFLSFKEGAAYKGIKMTTEEAKNSLESLVSHYLRLRQKIVFFQTELDLATALSDQISEEDFKKVIDKMFDKNFGTADAYLNRIRQQKYFEQPEILSEFHKMATLLLIPLPSFFPDYPFKTSTAK